MMSRLFKPTPQQMESLLLKICVATQFGLQGTFAYYYLKNNQFKTAHLAEEQHPNLKM